MPALNKSTRSHNVGKTKAFGNAAALDRLGIGLLRLGLVIVLLWIGLLKFVHYEAESIVPLVANGPLMTFFYHYPAPQYKQYMNQEGEMNIVHCKWHESSGTYTFSFELGALIVLIGILSFLLGVRRLIIKDAIMLGAAVITAADSATAYLLRECQMSNPA
jgi:uncharacterized membrane protein YkgB